MTNIFNAITSIEKNHNVFFYEYNQAMTKNMTEQTITLTVAKQRPHNSGTVIYNHDKLRELPYDTASTLDVSKPLSPSVAWALASDHSFVGTNMPNALKDSFTYNSLRIKYWSYLRSKEMGFTPTTVEPSLYANGTTPSANEIIGMMNDRIQKIATSEGLKGSVSICRAGFAKICINYSGINEPVSVNANKRFHKSGTYIIISTLNSEFMFEPTYDISFASGISKAKAYEDNEVFKLTSIVVKVLHGHFFHLLRLAQVEMSQSELDTKHLPLNLLDTHTICDYEEAQKYINGHITKLNKFLETNSSCIGAWISVQFYEPNLISPKVHLLRIFAIKPNSESNKIVKANLYVDFDPDIAGMPPAFADEVKQMLANKSIGNIEQNDDVTTLVGKVAGTAIPRDLQIINSVIPMFNLPNYWLKEIKCK
ncbi:hypothetical protein OTK49_02545 [Vibrio coralliirubri]|uniref:hypothetical protein n=1 Tax=Vibrio coralliirubri TaxID=1516159 RepID=UPI002283A4A7|nr:hypothetical protein [Vibrio coralliirubri]MCY9861396.1 hypothetical protein [Vibrio coralliirubri]